MRSKLMIGAAALSVFALTACGGPAGTSSTGEPEEPGETGATSEHPYGLEVVESPEFEEGTTMAELAEAGSITIGTKFDQPLFGLVGPDGAPVGFDVAIGSLIAAELGIPFESIEWTETVSANREPFIEQGQVDIVVATYTINDTRKEIIDFAGPYFMAGQALMVQAGNPEGITGPEDVEGQPVCSVEGSTPAATIVEEYGAELVATDVYSNCLDPLRNGQVVAVTTDNVILGGFVDQNAGEFELVADGETFTEEPYGIGLAKGDDEFRAFINDTLEAAFEDGRYESLWEQTAGAVLPTPEPPAVDRY
ncbi:MULTISPECIES: glutamate ABC transporter substrate-binding protein [Agrococcus]|jgi:glutamate transport system substrate-binding protein|uniref:glutamate ABC transporter substrate-binding protein n=1 Tax=Agrococcus TaxID=46352 RepID=UPI001FF6720D|nr:MULTISPECIES: glutamate ABC transporter substrate-binding protein [unclassified Agrococcus]MDR7232868.1 glutamate transport system substrate-binding protein [Agrococcus sp. BE272]UOW00140.1 glutamate ABC transporter substrate-binding protein [Agrococcus sp. SCSIO52902]